MEKAAQAMYPTDGFLLLDERLLPLFINPVATQILLYPGNLTSQKGLKTSLNTKIRSILVSHTGSGAPTIVTSVQSGRRLYQCRSYQVNRLGTGNSQSSIAVLLERSANKPRSLIQISDKYHLTSREKEVSHHLIEGLTTKEIATRMNLSPHTVKTFLRLIMVKMGVSTRSGILGKAFTPE
jgi:DNA-binding CsgD family transcriptional regulator